jgi:hypothetical protein
MPTAATRRALAAALRRNPRPPAIFRGVISYVVRLAQDPPRGTFTIALCPEVGWALLRKARL